MPTRSGGRSGIAAVRLAAIPEDDFIAQSRVITARGEFVRFDRIQETPGFKGFLARYATRPCFAEASKGILLRLIAGRVARCSNGKGGGDGGIRTLDRALQPYNGLANRRLQPLGHVSNKADMPDAGATRKRQIWLGRISANYLTTKELRQAALARAHSPSGPTFLSGATWIGSGGSPARKRSIMVR